MVRQFAPGMKSIFDPCPPMSKCQRATLHEVEKSNCETTHCAKKKSKTIDGSYKAKGPNDVSLLNNYNIDDVMKQFAKSFEGFFPYNFNMKEWKTLSFTKDGVKETPDSLETMPLASLYEKGYTSAGCIINTDSYHGGGLHWMALFASFKDKDNATVEFFNSSGNAPQKEYNRWLIEAKKSLESVGFKVEKVIVSRREHQKSETECGVYSLYYIYSRLSGVHWSEFRNFRIQDEKMFEFRLMIFYDEEYIKKHIKELFDDEKFMGAVKKKLEDSSKESKIINDYMREKKAKFCYKPLRYLILTLLENDPAFDKYLKFSKDIYYKLVNVKWAN